MGTSLGVGCDLPVTELLAVTMGIACLVERVLPLTAVLVVATLLVALRRFTTFFGALPRRAGAMIYDKETKQQYYWLQKTLISTASNGTITYQFPTHMM